MPHKRDDLPDPRDTPADDTPVENPEDRSLDTEQPKPTGASEPAESVTITEEISVGEDPEPTAPPGPPRKRTFVAQLGHPFRWGFLVTIGALVAIALATTLASLSTVLISIGVALFIALALDPVVRWLQRHGLSRGISILIVFLAFALIFGGLLSWLIPVAITQIVELAGAFPSYFESLQTAEWYIRLEEYLGQGKDVYSGMLDQAAAWLANPANLLTLGGGAVAVGTGAVNALSGSLIVLVLTLYFLASLNAMKKALYSLVPAHGRARFTALTEQITESVGSYVGGMVILAACNALFAFLLLTFLGVPFAPLLGFVALLITMIPMIGPFLFLITATIIALFTSPWTTALIFALVYFAYMEVEAYVLTPKVMNRAVNVPGALVLIGAMVGASLLGLLGALVAVPITASILIVVRQVVIPRQDAKVIRPAD